MRPCALVIPDVQVVVESYLCGQGFVAYTKLAKRLQLFHKLATTQVITLTYSECNFSFCLYSQIFKYLNVFIEK